MVARILGGEKKNKEEERIRGKA